MHPCLLGMVRVSGADTITVTRNETLISLNKPDEFILALVEFMDGDQHHVCYLRRPFRREPDFEVTSVNYDCAELLARVQERHEKAMPPSCNAHHE